MERRIPIRPLGNGSFGVVYLAYHIEQGIAAVKLILKERSDKQEREWESAIQITKHWVLLLNNFKFLCLHIRQEL
ncbi:MAG: hypothetical protein EZS28_053442 [Streblomastix strix]|uniref:Protein kinase domain-containing protein n=1 Tax=Streblomastix strix TaxID=222440 RepID=A0A5J4RBY8_9EUKA|nr:MAG: hypothetical protein EZS28_053442 [Streblomastix strix]